MMTNTFFKEAIRELTYAQEEWLERELVKRLPPIVIRYAKHREHLDVVCRYLQRRNIRLQYSTINPGQVKLMIGDTTWSVFEWTIKYD